MSLALHKLSEEDPTFRITQDQETTQTIISGMGELHLDIYVERMRREYKCDTIVGKPQVAFRETILRRTEFNYLLGSVSSRWLVHGDLDSNLWRTQADDDDVSVAYCLQMSLGCGAALVLSAIPFVFLAGIFGIFTK